MATVWDRSNGMATYPYDAALEIASAHAPHCDQEAILYGGGGWNAWRCTLRSLSVEKQMYYGHKEGEPRGYFANDDKFVVRANLEGLPTRDGDSLFAGGKFAPVLGSWRLGRIVENDGARTFEAILPGRHDPEFTVS